MQAFRSHYGIMLPIDRDNVDTDAIVPQRWLITVERKGLGKGLFGSWRYDEAGRDHPDFILNRPEYANASVIVARSNYGCGSSREHAVWAHLDYGIRAIVAPSYGSIFYENCLKNGLLPVVLAEDKVNGLIGQALAGDGSGLAVDLESNQLTGPDGMVYDFTMDAGRRRSLLDGQDDIAATLTQRESIDIFEVWQRRTNPRLG
ncbi:3-isopropylmalate dehydratase small subunit [Bordetella sp. BOR01]|uniref:3-isopropylmalate dehydratase small subunit n=1 Tax=Bordetella sp. BOR01 TaxID=2854779 RepID=UPI001C4556F8|nr:3-isopropylmalate dehydratase small subunit [Bordetella sp. BOR01]MBV7483392.1 3-isopropylmalate dehydratase small subunit [Bordetella sp. BOR01]